MPLEINTLAEFQSVISGTENLIVIDYYALWCGPCMRFNPTYELLAKKYPNVTFCKINFDNEQLKDVIKVCMIEMLPTFCFFKKGEYLKKIVGADQTVIEGLIQQLA